MIGICTFWNNSKGFGFVSNQVGEQIFLHITNFEKGRTPVLGSYVYYEIGPPTKSGTKPQCVSARPANLQELKMSGTRGAIILASPQSGGR